MKMKLETLVVKDVWNGHVIDRPVNHDLAKYSVPVMGDPMALVESIEHLPGTTEDYELDLKFRVRSLIPFNYAGELYYEYFARVQNLKIVEVRSDGLLLEFTGLAACNVVEKESEVESFSAWCGVSRQYLLENPQLLEPGALSEEDEMDLEDELSDGHACGVINDAVVILHDFVETPLTIVYDDPKRFESNYLHGSGKASFSSLTEQDLKVLDRELGYCIDFVETVTAPDGKEYRLIIIPHED